MNKLIKKLWLEALRSGEYKQGQDKLKRNDNSFCCLGVLCDLHRKETQGKDWDNSNCYYGEDNYLPPSVQDWAELFEYNPIKLSDRPPPWLPAPCARRQ